MHVVFPTTPAQYFHLLRRQIKRNYRKPLIVAAPKGLLRLPVFYHVFVFLFKKRNCALQAAASNLRDLEPGTSFRPVLDDPFMNHTSAKRVVILSGKIYYDLISERSTRKLDNTVAFVRIEELAPFPFKELEHVLEPYIKEGVSDVVFLQEEPRNQGPFGHVGGRINTVLDRLGHKGGAVYKGRKESALPAPGIGKMYQSQQRAVIQSAFEGM